MRKINTTLGVLLYYLLTLCYAASSTNDEAPLPSHYSLGNPLSQHSLSEEIAVDTKTNPEDTGQEENTESQAGASKYIGKYNLVYGGSQAVMYSNTSKGVKVSPQTDAKEESPREDSEDKPQNKQKQNTDESTETNQNTKPKNTTATAPPKQKENQSRGLKMRATITCPNLKLSISQDQKKRLLDDIKNTGVHTSKPSSPLFVLENSTLLGGNIVSVPVVQIRAIKSAGSTRDAANDVIFCQSIPLTKEQLLANILTDSAGETSITFIFNDSIIESVRSHHGSYPEEKYALALVGIDLPEDPNSVQGEKLEEVSFIKQSLYTEQLPFESFEPSKTRAGVSWLADNWVVIVLVSLGVIILCSALTYWFGKHKSEH